MIMEVQVISRDTIKPSIPTPQHLRAFPLSSLDPPQVYLPIIFFYFGGDRLKTTEKILQLRNSLSETLTRFYSLAGRIKEGYLVECNDEGVDFFDARVNGQLAQLLQHPNSEVLSKFLPCNYYSARSGNDVLLAVQINTFDCGGMAIGVCISHTIGDGASLATFVNAWASTARGSSDVSPIFPLTLLFPLKESSGLIQLEPINKKVVTKSFIFDGSKIEMLRARDPTVASLEYPTRVESVSALVWWCAMRARVDEGASRPSLAVHAVSLRGRMIPPLPDYLFGNIFAPVVAESEGPQDTQRCLELRLREAIGTIDRDYVKKLQEANGLVWPNLGAVFEKHCESDVDSYGFTSWCRFPLYDADFGWGKPVWVSSSSFPQNSFVLMGTRCGKGIEVWASMAEVEMAKFEKDEKLLAFAAPHTI